MGIAKKIGLLKDVIKTDSQINRIILKGLFEDLSLFASVSNIQDDFIIKVDNSANSIVFKTIEDGRFSIKLLDKIESKVGPNYMKTLNQFVVHYKEPGFPIYNSEY